MAKKSKLSELSYAELIARRDETKNKYLDIRFQAVVGHLENPVLKRTVRREIARLNTFIRQKEITGDTGK